MSVRARGKYVTKVDVQRFLGSDVSLTNPIYTSLIYGGVVVDPNARTWTLSALTDSVNVAAILAAVDVSDRWDRELGQVDLARYLGVACGPANPLDAQIIVGGAAIDPRDVSDRAARLLGIIYGDVGQLVQRAATRDLYVQLRSAGAEIDPRARTWTLSLLTDSVLVSPVAATTWDVSDRWARQVGQIDLARVLGAALSAANPVIAGVFDAAGNRMPTMDAITRPGYVAVTDGAQTLSIDASNRAETAPVQTTRTNLAVSPEREDLSVSSSDFEPSAVGNNAVLAAVAGQQHKIYACGYEIDEAAITGFRFGAAGSQFTRRITAGPIAQTFTHPMIGAANTALNFYTSAAVNAYVWVEYITE